MVRRSARTRQQNTQLPSRLQEIDDTESLNWSDDSSEDGTYEENTEVPFCDSDPDNALADDLDDAPADDLDEASADDLDEAFVNEVIKVRLTGKFLSWVCGCGYEGSHRKVERHYARVHLRSRHYQCKIHNIRSVLVFDLLYLTNSNSFCTLYELCKHLEKEDELCRKSLNVEWADEEREIITSITCISCPATFSNVRFHLCFVY
jgi:hypothetical protein